MIFTQIIIISLLVFAIHYTMLPGEIFGFVEKWWKAMEDKILEKADWLMNQSKKLLEKDIDKYDEDEALAKGYTKRAEKFFKQQQLLEKLSQPLFRCPVCMCPYYGTVLYWLIPWQRLGLPAHDWVSWVIIIISALGLNSIIVRWFKEDD